MSASSLSLAVGTVRWWVRLYTWGLAADRRDTRRAEIDCDLWEQGWDASRADVRLTNAALQILGRFVLTRIHRGRAFG